MFSLPHLLVVGLSAVSVAADWTTTKYDAIIVGAGPAGIIGGLYCVLLLYQADNEQWRVAWPRQGYKHYCSKPEVLPTVSQVVI